MYFRTARFSFDARRAERRDKKRRMLPWSLRFLKRSRRPEAGPTRGVWVERVFFTFQDEILHCGRQGHEVGAVADHGQSGHGSFQVPAEPCA